MTGDRSVAVSGPPDSDPPPSAPPSPAADPPDTGPPDAGSTDAGPSVSAAAGSGPADVRALIRTQLRIALGTCAIVMTAVTGLPVLLATVPAIARARVHGVPLWWLVLALGVQPLWIAVSRWQLRRAERAERDLTRPVGLP